jgi:hypothetical protein
LLKFTSLSAAVRSAAWLGRVKGGLGIFPPKMT